jgi:uncharacterized protein YjbJ (UPF0337 family)
MDRFSQRLGSVLAAFMLAFSSILAPMPVMALAINQTNIPIAFGAMSNKAKATAKDVEGKLESAYGDLTEDQGHQLKGKAKQVQASAMKAGEDLKDAAKTVQKKVSSSADQVADKVS